VECLLHIYDIIKFHFPCLVVVIYISYVWQVLREESTEATGAQEAETAAPLAAAADTSAVAREEPTQQEADSSAGGRENLSEGLSLIPVLRIRDFYPGSEFFHPVSRVKKIPNPGSGSASENFSIFNESGFFSLPGSGSASLFDT
jgi:hypothetical protein